METTIHQTFIRTSNLHRWMSNPQSHPVVQEIYQLFQRTYTDEANRHAMIISVDGDPALEHDGQEYPFKPNTFPANLTVNGCTYSRSTTHLGNSVVMFFPEGVQTRSAIPASISEIECRGLGQVLLLVRPFKSAILHTSDPFSAWPHFRASTWSRRLDQPIAIPFDWIVGQGIVFDLNADNCVVIAISRVCPDLVSPRIIIANCFIDILIMSMHFCATIMSANNCI